MDSEGKVNVARKNEKNSNCDFFINFSCIVQKKKINKKNYPRQKQNVCNKKAAVTRSKLYSKSSDCDWIIQ